MRIVFLDVDGVLNTPSTECMTRTGHQFIDEDKITILKKITDTAEAAVVVSSGWCYGGMLSAAGVHEGNFVSDFNELIDKLQEFKVSIAGRIDFKQGTPSGKGEGIRDWLVLNKDRIETFVVIDDQVDKMGFSNEYNEILFKTDKNTGITEEIANKAILKLTKTSSYEQS